VQCGLNRKEEGIYFIGCEREVSKLPFAPPGNALKRWQWHGGDDHDRQNVVGDYENDGYEHGEREVAFGVLQTAGHVPGKRKAEHVVEDDANHAADEGVNDVVKEFNKGFKRALLGGGEGGHELRSRDSGGRV
jgi:hypothetical protein